MSYEGSQEDPQSLHKYLYCQANPVNMTDPSGQDGDVASLDVSMNLMVGIAALSTAAVAEAKTHAMATLAGAAFDEAESLGFSASAATAYALSVYQTSVRDLIKQAQQVLKLTCQVLKNVKVVPVPRSIIPNVANHVAAAQVLGQPRILTRARPGVNVANRAAALLKVKGLSVLGRDGRGTSIRSLHRRKVVLERMSHRCPGWRIPFKGGYGGAYAVEKITLTRYIVVVTP